jgi:uncharacterized membrane protein
MACNSKSKADWLIPAGLLALSFIPIVGGGLRVVQLAGGPQIVPEHARFAAAPWPVVLHILSSVVYCVLGAFQFSPGLRRRRPQWHRAAGTFLIPCGLAAALTALWMTLFYARGTAPPESFDSPLLDGIRLLAGSAMALFLCLGFTAARRRDFPRHRAWMIRAYALGLGAGSQVFTHLPWFLFPSIQGELARALCMGAGWAINLAVAEHLISRSSHGPAPTPMQTT